MAIMGLKPEETLEGTGVISREMKRSMFLKDFEDLEDLEEGGMGELCYGRGGRRG